MDGNFFQFTGATSSSVVIGDSSEQTNNWTYCPDDPNGQPFWSSSANGDETNEASHCKTPYMTPQRYVPEPANEPTMSRNIRWTGARDSGLVDLHRKLAGVKRKDHDDECRVTKIPRMDERLATEMSGLSIDANSSTIQSDSRLAEATEIDDDATMSSDESTSRLTDVRLEMSDVLKKTLITSRRKPILPEVIAGKISNPCTDVMLWQPRVALLNEQIYGTASRRKATGSRGKLSCWNSAEMETKEGGVNLPEDDSIDGDEDDMDL